ncbi:unnamed protein product [Ectocarpus sp. 12 AP-2014]
MQSSNHNWSPSSEPLHTRSHCTGAGTRVVAVELCLRREGYHYDNNAYQGRDGHFLAARIC